MTRDTFQTIVAKLAKTEARAREIADMRHANETRWMKLYEQARQCPEWEAHCEQTGMAKAYNYGDIIC